MTKALLLGKFMPFHKGHIALIDFALEKADQLMVLVCANKNEPLSGAIRYNWVKDYYSHNSHIEVVLTEYDDTVLPSSSASSKEASQKWAAYLKENFPGIQLFISSEKYGEYTAGYWGIQFLCFDEQRRAVPVSASDIRRQPFKNWNYLPDIVRPYFVKKICIAGSESTGKSVLAERLAAYFNTVFVPEMAREVINETENCTVTDLYTIAALQAKTIIEKELLANKLLIVDTDVNITRSYGNFLFNTAIITEDWINKANRFDLYLFLETDCSYVQDGTRLDEHDREKLSQSHKKEFLKQNITYHSIGGNWEQRFETAIKIITKAFFEETA